MGQIKFQRQPIVGQQLAGLDIINGSVQTSIPTDKAYTKGMKKYGYEIGARSEPKFYVSHGGAPPGDEFTAVISDFSGWSNGGTLVWSGEPPTTKATQSPMLTGVGYGCPTGKIIHAIYPIWTFQRSSTGPNPPADTGSDPSGGLMTFYRSDIAPIPFFFEPELTAGQITWLDIPVPDDDSPIRNAAVSFGTGILPMNTSGPITVGYGLSFRPASAEFPASTINAKLQLISISLRFVFHS